MNGVNYSQWFDHCKRAWHTRETCCKLNGKHLNWKKKKKGGNEGGAFQASISSQGQESSLSTLSLTSEQLYKLVNLLESSTPCL